MTKPDSQSEADEPVFDRLKVTLRRPHLRALDVLAASRIGGSSFSELIRNPDLLETAHLILWGFLHDRQSGDGRNCPEVEDTGTGEVANIGSETIAGRPTKVSVRVVRSFGDAAAAAIKGNSVYEDLADYVVPANLPNQFSDSAS